MSNLLLSAGASLFILDFIYLENALTENQSSEYDEILKNVERFNKKWKEMMEKIADNMEEANEDS